MKQSLSAFCFSFLLLSFFCGISPCQARNLDHKIYHVVRVIDGDTIQLDHRLHVRLIGIDTPEVKYGPKFQRDLQERHLSKRTELRMGRFSYQFTKHLVLG